MPRGALQETNEQRARVYRDHWQAEPVDDATCRQHGPIARPDSRLRRSANNLLRWVIQLRPFRLALFYLNMRRERSDNLNTDIFGANLYHRYLTQQSVELTSNGTGSRLVIEHNISNFAMECHSILVEVGTIIRFG